MTLCWLTGRPVPAAAGLTAAAPARAGLSRGCVPGREARRGIRDRRNEVIRVVGIVIVVEREVQLSAIRCEHLQRSAYEKDHTSCANLANKRPAVEARGKKASYFVRMILIIPARVGAVRLREPIAVWSGSRTRLSPFGL